MLIVNTSIGAKVMATHEQNCANCRLATYCFPPGLNESHLHLLDNLVDKQKLYHRGDFIYKSREHFSHIYIIRSGTVKTYKENTQGDVTITGFCYPGEILGFNAIAANQYQENAVVLDTVSVCALRYNELEALSREFPCFQKQLVNLMSEKLSTHTVMNYSSSAESKVAYFLISISTKMKNYGTTGLNFHLSMSREDIAKHLGLASETVSRILSKFQINHLVEFSKKSVILKDLFRLQALAAQAV